MRGDYQGFIERYGPDELHSVEPNEEERKKAREEADAYWKEYDLACSLLSRVMMCPICRADYLTNFNYDTIICPNGHSVALQDDMTWNGGIVTKCEYCVFVEIEYPDDSVGYAGWICCDKNCHNLKGFPFKNGCKHFKVRETIKEAYLRALEREAEYNKWRH